jgi:hypothetical protein
MPNGSDMATSQTTKAVQHLRRAALLQDGAGLTDFNCVVLDVCRVTVGDFTLFGPGAVQIYTATHPMNADLRRK